MKNNSRTNALIGVFLVSVCILTLESATKLLAAAAKPDTQVVQTVLKGLYGDAYGQFPKLKDYIENTGNSPHKEALTILQRDKLNEATLRSALDSQAQSFSDRTGIYTFLHEQYDQTADLDYLEASPGRYGLPVTVIPKDQASSLSSSSVPPPPVITSLSKTKGTGRDLISIFGRNFIGLKSVTFNGEPAMDLMPQGTTEIQVFIPQEATSGKVRVETAGGYAEADLTVWQGNCDNKDIIRAFYVLQGRFPAGDGKQGECDPALYGNMKTYTQVLNAVRNKYGIKPLPPNINNFKPFDWAAQGTTVELQGSNFYAVDTAGVGGKRAAFQTIDNQTMRLTIPPDVQTGNVDVTLISALQGTGKRTYLVMGLPTITGLSPPIGKPGEDLTITGSGFDKLLGIGFISSSDGRQFRPTIKSSSPTSITVGSVLPDGTYTIEIRTQYGHRLGNLPYTVITPKPAITSIDPEGKRFGGAAIVVGKNFIDVTGVTFNGTDVPYTVTSPTQIRVNTKWGLQDDDLVVVTRWGKASKSMISNANQVTLNGNGNEERCFGAVGKGCLGDGSKEWGWGSQKMILPVGCGSEKDGWRNCWVVPGSIQHDNCCVRYPSGQWCEGPGTDGELTHESNHDGHCTTEWNHAWWDTVNWNAWVLPFYVGKPSNLTPVQSDRYSVFDYSKDENTHGGPSETVTTQNLCAPNNTAVDSKYGDKQKLFCCSKKLKKGVVWRPLPPPYGALYIVDMCDGDGARYGTQSLSKGKDKALNPPTNLPPPPNYDKRPQSSSASSQPASASSSSSSQGGIKTTIPISRRTIKQTDQVGPAVKIPASSASSPSSICASGTWSPTLKACVDSKNSEKRSPYDGLPCPGPNVPAYSTTGCISQ